MASIYDQINAWKAGQTAPTDDTTSTPTVPISNITGGPTEPTGGWQTFSGNAYDIAAQILAAQWSEWQKTYEPIELAAMDQSSLFNPSVLTDAVGKAETTAQGEYMAMPGMLNRQNAAMGIKPNAQQTQASNRIINVEKAAATAGAANKARSDVELQDEQLLLGAVPNMNVVKNVSIGNVA
jgi:hypothetical protein